MEIINKKAAVDLTDLAVGIIILGIVVSVGATLLLNYRDSRLNDMPVVRTTNESAFTTTGSTDTLNNLWGKTVVTITNNTGSTVGLGNYSFTTSALDGRITIDNSTSSMRTPWNVTYDWYNTSQADWAVADDAATGIAEYGNWFKIIVIVGIASLVLALIFMAFGKRGDSTSY